MRYEVRYRSHGQEWESWRASTPSAPIGLALEGDLDHITFVSTYGLRWQWRRARG